MDVYEQDAELRLLSSLLIQLERPTMVDVGAERGAMVERMLQAGIELVHAFDPHPDNAAALRARFGGDRRVTVHECAVSDDDGVAELHVSSDPNGTTLPFGHTLLERDDTDEIAWRATIPVGRRSLESLVQAGDIPASVGILKIDTEGHDLAVVQGMGPMQADVVMVEHWKDLPHGMGRCPWNTHEMVALLQARDFAHFAFIVHRDEFVTLKWDDGEVERGSMGNLVFFHESVLERVLPDVLDCAGWLAEDAVRRGQKYMHAAAERSALVDELKEAANDRLALVDELKQAADDRLALVDELKQAADDRLALVYQAQALADARLQALGAMGEELDSKNAELETLKQRIPR